MTKVACLALLMTLVSNVAELTPPMIMWCCVAVFVDGFIFFFGGKNG